MNRMLAVPPPVQTAQFAQLPPGWRQFRFSFPTNGETIVTSWRYRWSRLGPASAMPRDGIMINVLTYRRRRSRHDYPRRRLPLTLPSVTSDTLEGAPDTPEYRVFGRTRTIDYEVRVDIRNPHPSRRLLELAQRAVNTLRLPA